MTSNTNTATDFTPAPSNLILDEKVLKKLVGKAIAGVSGVLDAKDSLADIFKSDDDVTRGITVSLNEKHQAIICVRIITETGKNIPDIVNQITRNVSETLQKDAGITVQDLEVEVTDTMSGTEFEKKYRSCETSGGLPPMA